MQELSLGRSLTSAEIAKITQEAIRGTREGVIKGTRDYLMQYVDLVGSLSQLTLGDIGNGIVGVWNKITDPYTTINQFAGEMLAFKDNIAKAYEQIKGLGTYEYSYGGGYVGTTLGFVVGDPGAKLKSIVGETKISQVGEEAIKTIGKLQNAYKLKVIARYKDITGVDDILEISKKYNVVVNGGGGAVTIYGNKNSADAIIDVLKGKGRNLDNEVNGISTYISPNGLEKINSRIVSSSEQAFLDAGYNVNTTFDLMTKDGSKTISQELKFITPNN